MRPSGAHVHDHGIDPAVIGFCLVFAATAAVVEWIARNLWWLATVAGIIFAALVTAAIWWMRGAPGRKAEFAAAIAAQRAANAVPAAPRRELAGDTHVHHHLHMHGVSDDERAAIIRTAIPGQAGDAVTSEGAP